MITHGKVKFVRNICFRISKLGYDTDQYGILRQTLLDAPDYLKRLTPEFIIGCETPAAVRAFLSELIPANENRAVYKRRQRFLEQQFADLVYWSERDTLSSFEIEALVQVDCLDRATMDHVRRLMCDCAEVDPRGLSQTSSVDVSLATPTDFAASRPEVAMILSVIAAKLKSRSKDDFKGRHFEGG